MKSTSNSPMKQADLGLHLSTKRTRKRAFLDEMERVVPWADLFALITPMFRDFAALHGTQRLPDETTILRFRHLPEEHKLADQMLGVVNDMLGSKGLLLRVGTVVDATLIWRARS
jgi:transposase, IS5 family